MKYRIYCDPRPWPRTAGSGARRHSPAWYRVLKAEIRSQMSRQSRVVRYVKAWVRVYITVVLPATKATKYDYPPRGDVDNYAKTVLDALQRDNPGHESLRYWVFDDDRFVQALYVTKVWSNGIEDPGYIIDVEAL